MTRTVLVIGATGGIGGEVARMFVGRGWRVRALNRSPRRAKKSFPDLGGVEWIKGDALREHEVLAAAQGAEIIFHGANPPGYKNWRGLAIPMLENSIAAARATGARLVFPGNVYNFGPDAGAVVSEDAPQNPRTRKGRIRVEMEAMLKAAGNEGVRTLIVRAGDFFGAQAPGSWFQNVLVKPGRPVRKITYPGSPDVGHDWAYLPDLAEAIGRLVDAESKLAPNEQVHFAGHWFDRGIEMAHAIQEAVDGARRIPIKRFPWAAIILTSPFWSLARELLEVRYLWREPLRLDNAKLVSLIGEEPHTPINVAVRQSLEGLGCLPGRIRLRKRSKTEKASIILEGNIT